MKEVYAEVITIGDEILYGQITDTNTQWISAQLDQIGIKTRRKTSIGDREGEIINALIEAKDRADVILMTGGLGPTKDDITKITLARFFNTGLALDEEALEEVRIYFEKRGHQLTELNWGQANLPRNCKRITNEHGSAPGMWFEEDDKIFISMPGVPHEMKNMMTSTILSKLQDQFDLPFIRHRVLRTIGIGESWLAERIEQWEDALPEHIGLAYLPGLGQVRLRLTGVGTNLEQLEKELEAQIQLVMPMIGSYFYGEDDENIESSIGNLLREKELTLACAESCTGGYLAHLITSVPGCSDYFLGSITAYDNTVKHKSLGVSESTLQAHGAVSEATAKEMAEGIREKLGASIGLSTTGVAGPGGGTSEKPVGTVWIAYADKNQTVTRMLQLGDSREVNVKRSAIQALNLIRQSLE